MKPIGLLVKYSDSVKKSTENVNIKKVFVRDDEIENSLCQLMKYKELQHRTIRAETFSNDLAHEIRTVVS